MTTPRAASGLVVAALRKFAESDGGTAMSLAKGDKEAGGIVVLLTEKAVLKGVMERRTGLDGKPYWDLVRISEDRNYDEMLQSRRKSDPDLWIVELDIADAERFAVETKLIC